MEQGDVLDTEEAVAAEFAFGGPAASYRNQWLCVKAAFTQKNGIVFLGTALGAKSVAANVINEWFPGRRTPKSTTLVSDDAVLLRECGLDHHQLFMNRFATTSIDPSNDFRVFWVHPPGIALAPPLCGPAARNAHATTTQQCTQPPSARALLLLLLWVCGI